MNTLIRSLAGLFLGCLLAVNSAFALDYRWSNGISYYADPGAACNAAGLATYANHPTQAWHHSVLGIEGAYASCVHWYTWKDGTPGVNQGGNTLLSRSGTTCPSGTGPYDPSTGMCTVVVVKQVGDLCDDQTGATAQNPFIWDGNSCVKFFDANAQASCKYMGSHLNTPTAYVVAGVINSAGVPSAPPTFTANSLSCQAQTITSSECTVNVHGDATCNVMATFTGEVNAGGTVDAADGQCEGGVCPVRAPETTTTDDGCSPVSNGSGGSTCTQTKETQAEGSQQCGTVNGAYTCVSKPPKSNGVTTAITATTETLSNGDVKVTTVKDSTLTLCSDINTCTSTHSTTTSHTTTKPSGGSSTASTCVGSCTNTGGGVETVPGAGTSAGTGTGTCTGTDCGQGGDGTADVTNECASPPPCAGDPFQCAILKQAHIDTCKLMAGPTAEQSAAQDAKIAAEYSALDAHQATLDAQVSTLLGGFQSATSGGGPGGQCLPDIPFTAMGYSQTIEFSRVCEPLSFVRLALLAGAYLIAARVVMKEA